MTSLLRQILAMLRATLLSLPRRVAISLSMVASIMLVVIVLAGFLAMARGFEATLSSAGSPNVAVVLGGGAREEARSEVSADLARRLMAMRDDIGAARDAGGEIVLSRELVTPVERRAAPGGAAEMLALRGMDRDGPDLRDGVSLSAGRLFAPGAREIVVGERLAADRPGLAIGRSVRLGPVDWTVTGHFAANGSAFESEIWADLDAVRAAFDREGDLQSLRLRLTKPSALDRLRTVVEIAADGPVAVLTEADLYAGQSAGTSRMIRLFGWPIALLMAIGATAGALNTMMNSLSDRTVEIATVRALGFSRLSAVIATWAEAALLSVIGVSLGLGLAWLIFNDWQASTLGANNARMAFALVVDAQVMATAGLLGLSIGFVGGAAPALAAARLPITAALSARG